jgi:hypothetical protein
MLSFLVVVASEIFSTSFEALSYLDCLYVLQVFFMLLLGFYGFDSSFILVIPSFIFEIKLAIFSTIFVVIPSIFVRLFYLDRLDYFLISFTVLFYLSSFDIHSSLIVSVSIIFISLFYFDNLGIFGITFAFICCCDGLHDFFIIRFFFNIFIVIPSIDFVVSFMVSFVIVFIISFVNFVVSPIIALEIFLLIIVIIYFEIYLVVSLVIFFIIFVTSPIVSFIPLFPIIIFFITFVISLVIISSIPLIVMSSILMPKLTVFVGFFHFNNLGNLLIFFVLLFYLGDVDDPLSSFGIGFVFGRPSLAMSSSSIFVAA